MQPYPAVFPFLCSFEMFSSNKEKTWGLALKLLNTGYKYFYDS